MKKLFSLLILYLIVSVHIVSAITFWVLDGPNGNPLSDFTGGTAGCLDAIDGDLLSAGDRAEVYWDYGNGIATARFILVGSNPPAESEIDAIIPDTNPGTKWWSLTDAPYRFGTIAPTNPETWLLWVDTTSP